MAGYLGTKAVLLSTTAATVTGDAEINGGLTVGNGVDVTGDLTVGNPSGDADIKLTTSGSGSGASDGLLLRLNTSGSEAYLWNLENGLLSFGTNNTERMRIDASGNVGIGISNPSSYQGNGDNLVVGNLVDAGTGLTIVSGTASIGSIHFADGPTGDDSYRGFIQYGHADNWLRFATNATERMRIDSSGNLLVGKTTSVDTTTGFNFSSSNYLGITRDGNPPLYLNRLSSAGRVIEVASGNTITGTIGTVAHPGNGEVYISGLGANSAGLLCANGNNLLPLQNAGLSDNIIDLGANSYRYDDIYATNGTIQTSDANEKQQIAELTTAEMQAAKAISKLFKTFKWNDSVAEKGVYNARIHSGVIAQEVEAAMADAGLDAGKYAFFISSTWWESTEVIPAVEEVLDEEGNVVTEAQPERTVTHTHMSAEEAPEGAVERNRKGIRYPQLLSFIGAATEQRLASIEARLDALEAN